jgi:hypothetical protein
MGRGLHEPGEEVTWTLQPEQAYALPPAIGDELAQEDPEAT